MRLAFKFRNKFSKPKEKFSFGLDIGSSTIKLVKLKFLKDTVELCGFDLQPTQSEPGEVLKKTKESQGIDVVNIAASGPATVIRYVTFPKMNNLELRQALKFEAQKHIPFSIDEVNLDGYILKEDLADDKMLVMLAAVKKEFISQRLKIITEAGLKPKIVDIDSLALINAFNFNYPQDNSAEHKAIALLNIGALTSNLDILEDGLPRLSRDIHIAGNNFTQRLQDALGLDFKSAEELKLNPARDAEPIEGGGQILKELNPDKERANKIAVAMESVLANLATEIRTSFDYYESQSASSVAKIFLSGGGSQIKVLKDMLANLLGIEVQYWDPLKRINIASNVDAGQLKALSSQLAVAVGLALRK